MRMTRIILEYVTIANIFYLCVVMKITYNLLVSQGRVSPSADSPHGYNALGTGYQIANPGELCSDFNPTYMYVSPSYKILCDLSMFHLGEILH